MTSTRLQIASNVTFDELESLTLEVLRAAPSEIQVPLTLGNAAAPGLASSLVQLVVLWARKSPRPSLQLSCSIAEAERVMATLSLTSYGLTALSLSKEVRAGREIVSPRAVAASVLARFSEFENPNASLFESEEGVSFLSVYCHPREHGTWMFNAPSDESDSTVLSAPQISLWASRTVRRLLPVEFRDRFDEQRLAILGSAVFELLENTYRHGRLDEQANPIAVGVRGVTFRLFAAPPKALAQAVGSNPEALMYFMGRALADQAPEKRFIEVSVFDSGLGLARWTRARLQESTANSELLSLSDEELIKSCLLKHATASAGLGAGVGLYYVLQVVRDLYGLFRIRTGASCLVKRTQLPKNFPDEFDNLQGKLLVRFCRKLQGERPPKPFLIDGKQLIELDAYRTWLKSRSLGDLPASCTRVVYQDDIASKRSAEIVCAELNPHRASPLLLTSVAELEVLPVEERASVVVVAAVVGSGMALMRICKALRRYQPRGARYFLLGVVVSRTLAQFDQLRANLELAPKGLTYRAMSWCAFAPATDALVQFRRRELKFWTDRARELSDQGQSCEAIDARRAELAVDGVLVDGESPPQPFLSLSGRESAFDLSDGFALWHRVLAKRCPEDVLFTVACWLQSARENRALPVTDRLDSGGFGHVVIAPDCFLRFTDPVIQCAILRCALDSELDYRSSPATSARAREVISKLIEMREDSVPEFCLALLLGRMRLCEDDRLAVARTAKAHLSGGELPTRLAAALNDT